MEHYSDADDVAWHTFAIENIVPMKHASPLWRIVAANLNVYFCNRLSVAEALTQAKDQKRIVKVGVVRDTIDKEWIISLSLTAEQLPLGKTPPNPHERHSPQLLF